MSSRGRRRAVVGSFAIAVVAAGLGAPPVFSQPDGKIAAQEPDDGPLVRQDTASARATATSTGKRVEDLSQGDSYTSIFAEPDGSWTAESSPEPVRAKSATGSWAPVDTALEEHNGRLRPKNVPVGVSLSTGDDQAFATVQPDATVDTAAGSMTWHWPADLPAPTVDGATATYADVTPNGDLVVTATATGFTHNIVLHEPPAPEAPPLVLSVPVTTPGAEIRETADGTLVVKSTDAGHETIASAPAPLMWDASNDPDATGTGTATGKDGPEDPVVAPVDVAVVDTAAGGRVGLRPDMDFLTDPDTVYPVTIDPSITTAATADTWIMNAGYTSSQSTSEHLRAGTYDDGTHLARTFLKVPGISVWKGKQIIGAGLYLRNYSSTSCNAGAIRVQRVTEPWSTTGITWGNQPLVTSMNYGQYSAAHGYGSSCPQADAHFPMTEMVRDWAEDGLAGKPDAPFYGVRLSAATETNPNSWRAYRSTEFSTESYHPVLVVNYNSFPSTAYQPSATGLSIRYVGDPAEKIYVAATRTPTVSAKASDDDLGDQVRLRLRAYASADLSSSLLGECTTAWGTPDTALSCTLPPLPNQTTFYLRAKAVDSRGAWGGRTFASTSGWSSWRPILVDAPTSGSSDPIIAQIIEVEPWRTEADVLKMIQDLVDQSTAAGVPLTFAEAKESLYKAYLPALSGCAMTHEVEFEAVEPAPEGEPSLAPASGTECLDETSATPEETVGYTEIEDLDWPADEVDSAEGPGLEADEEVSSAEATSAPPMLHFNRSRRAHKGQTKWGLYTMNIVYYDDGAVGRRVKTIFNWQAAPWLQAGATTPAVTRINRTPTKPTVCHHNKPSEPVGYNWHWKCWTTPNRNYGVVGVAVWSGIYNGISYRVTSRINHMYRVAD